MADDFQFDLPLELNGTEHQLKVWYALREIPSGQIQTYGGLAKSLHSSPRAIGQACGNNPIPIVIPCHRIVGKNGLGGFMHSTESKELNIKHWLLAHEQR
jgi:methylated-DNA-[protein]-cysteine S-methyltransferase